VFVNSLSDRFHENLSSEAIRRVCRVMADVPWHTYQVLTKRSGRMRDLLCGELRELAGWPRVWWGVSVENRRHGYPRIEHLRQVPAALRFLSIEPLLEALARSTSPVSIGSSWAAKAGQARGRCGRSGCCR
jgi:protein gp37